MDGAVTGAVGRGLVVLVGTTHGDTAVEARFLAQRVAGYRVFPDADGRTNLSVLDIGGAVLVVPQFTLYASTRKGTRPSFTQAGPPDEARELVQVFEQALRGFGLPVASGVFGADMAVDFVNDGPFTILLEREAG